MYFNSPKKKKCKFESPCLCIPIHRISYIFKPYSWKHCRCQIDLESLSVPLGMTWQQLKLYLAKLRVYAKDAKNHSNLAGA